MKLFIFVICVLSALSLFPEPNPKPRGSGFLLASFLVGMFFIVWGGVLLLRA